MTTYSREEILTGLAKIAEQCNKPLTEVIDNPLEEEKDNGD